MFLASEAWKKLNCTASKSQIEEYRSAYPISQEYQKLEGKLKQDLTRGQ